MKPAPFEYLRPTTLDETIGLLDRHDPDAKILAGGQSLVPLMNFRLAQPRYVVDCSRIRDLSHIRAENGSLVIGAMARQAQVEDSALVRERCPLLSEATALIGHRTIRNRGTVGGSLAHADPSAEYPAVLAALGGSVTVQGPAGRRTIAAEDLFVTVCMTTIAPSEVLTEVRLPTLAPSAGWAFVELSRRHGDYAIVGVAAVVSFDGGDLCSDVRIALAGVGQTPIRCHEAEEMLKWSAPNPELVREACESCASAAEPQDDLHASASYKRAMVEVFVKRALETAIARAGARRIQA